MILSSRIWIDSQEDCKGNIFRKEWVDSLFCKVIRLNGEEELNKSAEIIVEEFFSQY